MEVLNPTYMASNKNDKKRKILNFILHFLMQRDGVDKMFPFAKQDINEWGSKYEQKKYLTTGSYKVCRQLTPTSIKHPKVTALLLLVQMGHTKHCSMYKYIYFGIFWRLK